jgi:uncharacterized protein (TIGR00255 family)
LLPTDREDITTPHPTDEAALPALPPISSMTGFARVEGAVAGQSWAIEIKSVNGKGLDVRCRAPVGFDAVEATVRTLAAQRLKRGSVTVGVTVSRDGATGQIRINRPLLDEVLALAREIEAAGAAPPRIDALLAVRGVIDAGEEVPGREQRAAVEAALAAAAGAALERLAAVRIAEGAQLAALLAGHVETSEALAGQAAAAAATQPETLRARLKAQVADILGQVPSLPPERVAQEVALLVARGDVREEIDRLRAHVEGARALLGEGGAVGRRLDFLCQEFNREANTLCSKSTDVALTRIGLDLKAAIEQLREQVQNVE